jgi:hypothetical protein
MVDDNAFFVLPDHRLSSRPACDEYVALVLVAGDLWPEACFAQQPILARDDKIDYVSSSCEMERCL